MYGIHCFYTIYTKLTFQLLLLSCQERNCFAMLGERKHIHAYALRHTVTLLLKILQISDQCLGIAGDINDSFGTDLDYGAHEFFSAAASGRIHQDDIYFCALASFW